MGFDNSTVEEQVIYAHRISHISHLRSIRFLRSHRIPQSVHHQAQERNQPNHFPVDRIGPIAKEHRILPILFEEPEQRIQYAEERSPGYKP